MRRSCSGSIRSAAVSASLSMTPAIGSAGGPSSIAFLFAFVQVIAGLFVWIERLRRLPGLPSTWPRQLETGP